MSDNKIYLHFSEDLEQAILEATGCGTVTEGIRNILAAEGIEADTADTESPVKFEGEQSRNLITELAISAGAISMVIFSLTHFFKAVVNRPRILQYLKHTGNGWEPTMEIHEPTQKTTKTEFEFKLNPNEGLVLRFSSSEELPQPEK